jgi:Spy/CpxP family protein refolding chaperone
MKRFLLIAGLLAPLAAAAQPPPQPPQPPPGSDPIGRYLAPPELVMSQSEEIGLTDKQRAAIKAEIQKTQAKFLDAQWDLQEHTGKMSRLLQQTPVDEAKVLEEADRVMSLEREIKRAQLTLLIRIRNALTAEQNAKLEALRRGK